MTLWDWERKQTIEGQFASEEGIEGFAEGSSKPYGQARATPWNWNHSNPTQGMKIGWELRRNGKVEASFAFAINPQSINRMPTTRAQLYATRSQFYVDDFGPGSETIQIGQLVASGKGASSGFVTLREDILKFRDDIWMQAVGKGYGTEPLEVYFYDNHLFHGVKGAVELPERVWFPPTSLSLERAVNLQNVWRLSLTMMTLEKPVAAGSPPGAGKSPNGTTLIIVRKTEDVQALARKHAGKSPSSARVKSVAQAILKLNPDMKRNRTVPIFSAATGQQTESHEVKSMHVLAGEKVLVPS